MGKCCTKEIKNIKNTIKDVLKILINNNKLIKDIILNCTNENFKKVKKELNKNTISQMSETMDKEILKVLSCEDSKDRDIFYMLSYLKSTNEIIKIASSTRLVVKKLEKNCKALNDETVRNHTSNIYSNIIKVLENSYKMIDNSDKDEVAELHEEVILLGEKIDNTYDLMSKYNFSNMNESHLEIILSAIRESEKIVDRAMGIASLIRYPYSSKNKF